MEQKKEVQVAPTKELSLAKATSFLPATLEEAKSLATVLAASTLIPVEFRNNAPNTLVAIMLGAEVGITAMQSLQNIMVVNGRPSMWGDLLMGIVKASKMYESSSDKYDPTLEGGTQYFTVKRKGEEPVTRSFSMEDAKKASLDRKPGPWQQYPKRMLLNRARAFALRDVFPDLLKGIRIREEMDDVVETVLVNTAPPAADAAAAAREAFAPKPAKTPDMHKPVDAEIVPEPEPAKTEEKAPVEVAPKEAPQTIHQPPAKVVRRKF